MPPRAAFVDVFVDADLRFESSTATCLARGRAAFCSRAARRARGAALLIIDAGCSLTADAVDVALAALQDSGAAAIALPLQNAGRLIRGLTLGRNGWPTAVVDPVRTDVLAPAMESMLVRRDELLALGGFDPEFDGAGEDLDFGWRCWAAGGRVVACDAAASGPYPLTLRHETPAARARTISRMLAAIWKNAGPGLRGDLLPATLAAHVSELASPGGGASLAPDLFAIVAGLTDFAAALPALSPPLPLAARAKHDVRVRPLIDGAMRPFFTGEDSPGLLVGPPARDEAAADPPDVSIVVLTALGRTHLTDCLRSLDGLDYPRERLEVLVVSNGVEEDLSDWIDQLRPGTRLHRLAENRGFCGGNNEGARVARGRWLLFLNDDTRVAPPLVRALTETADRRDANCVAALILNWTGTAVDFGGGGVNFEGKGFQDGLESTDLSRWRRERPVLFACGAGMLIERDLFIELGGFPESYFAYYEDVALGWLLRMTGGAVWLAPDAIVYHKHHGTSGPASSRVLRLCERNGLCTVFTHLEERHVGDAMSAALLLSVSRIALLAGYQPPFPASSPLRRAAGDALRGLRAELRGRGARRAGGIRNNVPIIARALPAALRGAWRALWVPPDRGVWAALISSGRNDAPGIDLSPDLRARLDALTEWAQRVPELRARRARYQRLRRRSDREVLSRFADHWLDSVPAPAPETYGRLHAGLHRSFGLDAVVRAADDGIDHPARPLTKS